MSPQEQRYERFKRAVRRLCEAQEEYEIAKALLTVQFEPFDEAKYDVTIGASEAAKEIGVSRKTVIRAIESGELPAGRNDAGRWRIKASDWRAWKRAHNHG